MGLVRIDLTNDRGAWIREESTIGEVEDVAYLEKFWVSSAPEHAQNARKGCTLPIVCVKRWDGMPEGFTWPDLPHELTKDNPSIATRFASLRAHVGMKTLHALIRGITAAMIPSDALEGN